MNVLMSPIRALWRVIRPVKKRVLLDEYRMLEYALNEISELHSLVRYLLPRSEEYQEYVKQTRESFEYQWRHLPTGTALLADQQFRAEATSTVERFTSLPKEWFKGKKVLDAGCGNGRWSWALCELGAEVTAIDQSASAIQSAAEACAAYPSFKGAQCDLLSDVGMPATFDLVWSYGVAHHTGNTYLAIENVAKCVKPGGYLFLMIYREPRFGSPAEFAVQNQYTALRRTLKTMDFEQRVQYLRQSHDEKEVHGWFDALSPSINDLHRFDEIVEWLQFYGFSEIKSTVPPSHAGNHIIAKRLPAPFGG